MDAAGGDGGVLLHAGGSDVSEKRAPTGPEVLGWIFMCFCILYTVVSLFVKLVPPPHY